MPGLLEGKRLLITGVLTDDSLAFSAARLAQEQGAQIVLTGAGRGLRLTQRVARHLPDPPDVLELDITDADQVAAVVRDLTDRWGAIDGALHAIAFAPASALGGGFLDAGWDEVKVALEVSAYSLKTLAVALRPLLAAAGGGSIVGLDFDARIAWPGYDWMGVAKAALESSVRYLASELGAQDIRVNTISAGPVKTLAASGVAGFSGILQVYRERAALKRNIDAGDVAGAAMFLLSDWSKGVSGEVIYVDAGYRPMGM